MKALILAGGYGTRMGIHALDKPKPLVNVNGKPLIKHVINAFPDCIDEIGITTGYKGEKIINELGSSYNNIPIHYFKQEKISGTAYALFSAKSWLCNEKNFLVTVSDDIFIKPDLEKLISLCPSYGLVFRKPNKSGIAHTCVDAKGNISGFKKINDDNEPRNFFGGACSLSGEIFKTEMIQLPNGEYSLPHTIMNWDKEVKAFFLNFWLPVNSMDEKLEAEKLLKK